MKNLYRLIACLFILNLIISCTLSAQTATINSVDPSGYPWLRAYYSIKDASDNEVRVNSAADVIIKENGEVKTQKPNGSPFCSPPVDKTFSVVLVIDASASMFGSGIDGTPNGTPTKIEVVINTLDNFITSLDSTRTECSIIEFGTSARMLSNWTNNKDSLLASIDINNIYGMQYTDYNSAFLGFEKQDFSVDSTQSALYLVQSAKFKRVIVFLTDGNFNAPADCIGKDSITGQPVFLLNDVINLAKNEKTQIYCVQIGPALDSTSLSYLESLASVEGNSADNLKTNIQNADSLGNFYQNIADSSGTPGYVTPCYVIWQSQCTPSGTRTVELDFPNNWNLSASTSFTIPDNVMPMLDISSRDIPFVNVPVGTTRDSNVTLTAKNNYTEITGASSTDAARFYVKNWEKAPPFTLNKDEATTITVTYAPTDIINTNATITITGSSCSGNDITLSGVTGINDDNKNFMNIVNYPNPFTQKTSIVYTLDKQANVELSIYDLFGNKVKALLNEVQEAGTYNIDWDGINSAGEKVSSGTYFYQIKTDGKILTKQMLIIR